MIQTYTIRSKLIGLFILTFIMVCVLFIVLLQIEKNAHNEKIGIKQEELITILSASEKSNHFNNEFKKDLENMGFKELKQNDLALTIHQEGRKLFEAKEQDCTFSSLLYRHNIYLSIVCKHFDGIFKQKDNDRVYGLLLTSFFFFSFLLIFMYFSVLNSLKPFKKLKNEIIKINSGQTPDFKNYSKDEIGMIALEFDKAYCRNQDLIHSRQLFLRTIMHELKTPIGKGRIISEMTKDEKQKERLIDIFKRMNNLINEFAKIENLFSKNYNLILENHNFSTFLNEARNSLLRDDFDKVIKINLHDDPIINADIEIFSLIIKNLLDNALKYSTNNTCELECFHNYFVIKNHGQTLEHPLEFYLKAFTRDKNTKDKEGMGLGLYIIYEVCKLHNFELKYKFKNHTHHFKVFFGENDGL
ncbi:HAMP domain-containing histidine kinase [Campylobacter helveticus]|uniref:ArsS family sensor histidine kinase n=1 Tax=Campylobacter helveticus TaxID=28898 RepID=UPI00111204DB|nr:ArsS family sensor histidine kinase [Campylobacter helveticus]TNB61530.1 HAMP domain-containing histidine kinase [Campylobacter helveticus]